MDPVKHNDPGKDFYNPILLFSINFVWVKNKKVSEFNEVKGRDLIREERREMHLKKSVSRRRKQAILLGHFIEGYSH